MKKLLIVLFLVPMLAFGQKVPMYKQFDKQLHFAVGMEASAAAYAVVYGATQSKLIASAASIAFSFVLGVSKEIYDYYDYGLFDWKDVEATTLGSLPLVITVDIVLWGKKRKKR